MRCPDYDDTPRADNAEATGRARGRPNSAIAEGIEWRDEHLDATHFIL